MRVRSRRMHCKAVLLSALVSVVAPCWSAPPGTVIENTARATFDAAGTTGLTANSNTVSVTTTVVRTDSNLALYQYRPSDPSVNEQTPSECRSGTNGSFVAAADPVVPQPGAGTASLDPDSPLALAPAALYHSGEPVFIRVEDGDQNGYADAADTVVITVTSDSGDTEDIRLTETGLNTGVFIGYVQTVASPPTAYDCQLSVAADGGIEASYTDPFDESDASSGRSLVDPFGIVFSSLDGQPVDDIAVRLIDADTGQPAEPGVDLFGDDGVSAYPNTVVTGSTATDSGGSVYNFPAGGFRFPLVVPGNYRLEIVSAPGYITPSTVDIADLQQLDGAPFALLPEASFGQTFNVPAGPPVHVDIPADPSVAELVVTKDTLNSEVAVGDFVQYRVTVDNVDADSDAIDARVIDTLPQGFRYRSGSARLNGEPIGDPAVDNRGRTLAFSAGDLSAGDSLTLTYVTVVGAGTPLGEAVNSARASDALGASSNTAQTVVNVRDELMRERNILMGRVIVGNCPAVEPETGRAALRMQSAREGDGVVYELQLSVDKAAVRDYRVEVMLPDALDYVDGSTLLDGRAFADPVIEGRLLTYTLDGSRFQDTENWQHRLRFRTELDKTVSGRFITEARATMETPASGSDTEKSGASGVEHITPAATNVLLRNQPEYRDRRFVFRPVFPTLEARLEDSEKRQLDKIIDVIRDVDIVKVSIQGHADNRPIQNGVRTGYHNNLELSRARARTVAPYFQSKLNLRDDQLVVGAAGDSVPLVEGEDTQSRALNRRVDITVDARVPSGANTDKVVVNDSGEVGVDLHTDTGKRRGPAVGTDLDGLKGARVYMEDGTYAVTDKEGKYHIEGVKPGTHVLQLDLTSLPDGMRVVECEQNTRFAGAGYSRFVDLRPGSMWRVDFHVEENPPVTSQARVQLHTELHEGRFEYRLDNTGGQIPVDNYRVTVALPAGVEYLQGSSRLAGEPVKEPRVSDNMLIYRLGDFPAGWDKPLTFTARQVPGARGRLVTKAAVVFDTESEKGLRVAPVETTALIEEGSGETDTRRFELRSVAGEKAGHLSIDDKQQLDDILPGLLNADIRGVKVSESGSSGDHAEAVASYLRESLGLNRETVTAQVSDSNVPRDIGEGPGTVIEVETAANGNRGVSAMLRGSSDPVTTEVVGSRDTVSENGSEPPPSTKRTIEAFDQAWLEQAEPGVEWLMPQPGYIPPIPAVNVAIKHAPGDTIKAHLNGEPMNPLFFFGTKKNNRGTVARSYWQGIHLKEGANRLEFVVFDNRGREKRTFKRIIHFTGPPVRAEVVQEQSRLVADGRQPPVVAVRFFDRNDQPVRPGVQGQFEVLPPYYTKEQLDSMEKDLLAAYDRDESVYEVGERGIAYIELEPTSQSGEATLVFEFNDKRRQKVHAWLRPEARDWIVVGLADATIGSNGISGDASSAPARGFEDDSQEGRVALFAKGNLNENWLLTTSVDSDKEEAATGNGLFQTVDPDEYFQLYGDDTEQRYEAPSSEKLYMKLEREGFYTLFGDYDTGLNNTELSKYNRRVTGLKSELHGDLFSFNSFATETSQRFVRDEIRGEGASGLYHLTRSDIVLNSETIVIETRDRFHSQDILEKRTLRRHYDYNIDYQAGTVYFRQPIPSRDNNFNPTYIVVEYETQADTEGDLTYGGRGQFRLADGDFLLGLSGIRDGTFADQGRLYGMDAEYRIGSSSRLRLEYAASETDDAGVSREGDAYLAEYDTRVGGLDGRVYMREQQGGFGLGQQAGSENATRKYGLDGSYKLTDHWRLNSEVFHQDNLATSATRDVVEADVAYGTNRYTLMTGLRNAKDVLGDGTENESELLLAGASTKVLDNKLQLSLNSEVALNNTNANAAYPTRYIVGAEYAFTPNISTYIQEEITEGENQDSRSTRLGVRATPWKEAKVDSALEQRIGEYGPRTFAVMGLTQGFRLNEQWSADISYDRVETIREPGDTPFNVNVPPQSGTFNNDFTAVSTGLTYRGGKSTLVSRLEQRQAEQEDKQGVLLGWHRDLKAGISYGFDTQYFASEYADGGEAVNGNARFSLAYRPVTSKWMHLNRLEYKFNEQADAIGGENRTRKLINNWKANYMPDRRNQLAFSYGIKYVLDNFDGDEYDGVTHYAGTEYRFDLTPRWDIGAHADTLISANAGNREYSYGLSTGYNLIKNLWVSVGYNFDGFKDDDFSGSEYTADGPYVKLRFKFDQNTFGFNN